MDLFFILLITLFLPRPFFDMKPDWTFHQNNFSSSRTPFLPPKSHSNTSTRVQGDDQSEHSVEQCSSSLILKKKTILDPSSVTHPFWLNCANKDGRSFSRRKACISEPRRCEASRWSSRWSLHRGLDNLYREGFLRKWKHRLVSLWCQTQFFSADLFFFEQLLVEISHLSRSIHNLHSL